jgi:hypothetical protein
MLYYKGIEVEKLGKHATAKGYVYIKGLFKPYTYPIVVCVEDFEVKVHSSVVKAMSQEIKGIPSLHGQKHGYTR